MRARVVLLLVLAAVAFGAGAILARGRGAETPAPAGLVPGAPLERAANATPASAPAAATPAAPTAAPVTLVGAGDIASCRSDGDEATAALIDAIPGTVFTAGDDVYERGSAAEFAECYTPSWGRHRARTRPAAGNHEYLTFDATAYFAYFGEAAGEAGKGYYSYDLGAWHIVVLNSNCFTVFCDAGDPQERWLRADLASSVMRCTLAIWHHPRFSSGQHGGSSQTDALWRALYEANAEIIVNGHDHHYERFAPQDPDGRPDRARGIRQFIVGTGGRSLYRVNAPIANSEIIRNDTFGVLKLTLRDGAYDWEFVPIAGSTFTDTGSGACH